MIDSIIVFVQKYDELIDRIDFDWEFISNDGKNYGYDGNIVHPDDPKNFAALIESLRKQLDNKGFEHVELTAAVSGVPDYIRMLPVPAMVKYLDAINIMTYDYMSSEFGLTLAGHQSNLFSTTYAPKSVKTAVDTFMQMGAPANKLVIGVAFYSRGFANTAGLGKSSNGVVSDRSTEPGMCDYASLPRDGAVEYWDPDAKAGYSYDPVKKILNSYDTVRAVAEKSKFVHEMGLKGVIGTISEF